ncbi:NAD(P)-dependent oxidoreductase [Pseudomonas sp. LRF_L74]|uniref:NAD(P)-dependent oxidoreductase n=1 Tax=Pseudomonas sp. LRF_L74 TaxID=3369422 RepID=UPI003F5F2994
MKKIALIGATGFVGSAVLAELTSRKFEVTALVRTEVDLGPAVKTVFADVYDERAVARAVAGHDAVISAFNAGWNDPELYEKFVRGSAAIERGVEQGGVKRLLVVGGAGSLFVAPGVQLVDTPQFTDHVPANVVPGARAARDVLTRLRDNTTLDWTFLSPAALLEPGERSGEYRLGGEELLMDGERPAGISVADLAVAIVDEIEQPRHVRSRFTVARTMR